MTPFTARKRRRATDLAPTLFERIEWRRLATGAGMLAGVALVVMLLALALDRPVQRVLVEGAFQRVSPPQVESAVARVARGGLTSVDLEAVRAEVRRIPWVDGVIVQRRWPDALRVSITEQVAAARWNDTGLLNTRGHLFIRNARFAPPELPLLEGPEGSEGAVAQVYLDAQGRLLEAGLRLTGVRLDERGDRLAPLLVGQPDDRGVGDGRVQFEALFDLLRVHLLAAGVDALAAPAEELDGAVGLDLGPVAGDRVA
ncbi:MAG TPA: FtsQ-type POTRA domain-containing protein, partial [Steroidobacteraceae bacterium]|nr:FtsQ-type POTRA domain-containing protein [Steroidobacteraceae bacterium]